MWRKATEYAAIGLLFLLVGSLVFGQLFGQPIFLSYVKTGSMAPTLQPGDGFIAVPMSIAGPVEEGDVIVFRAETLHGGGLTTHRVVDETSRGYITKGDANPVTDQASGEPPVKRPQITAKALQIGGKVVVIPKIGTLVVAMQDLMNGFQRQLATLFNTRALLGTQGLAYLLFAIGIGSYIATEFRDQKQQTREVERPTEGFSERIIVVVLTVLIIVFLTASMTIPAGTQTFEVVSSSTDAPGPKVIPSGTSESFSYRVPSNGVLPVVVFLEPSGERIRITPTSIYVPSNSVRESVIEIRAPPERGYYRYYLVEHRYLALLPLEVITALYEIHSWLPILVIDLIFGGSFASLGFALIRKRETRDRPRQPSFLERIRRRLK